jgi:acetyl esterase/lipase
MLVSPMLPLPCCWLLALGCILSGPPRAGARPARGPPKRYKVQTTRDILYCKLKDDPHRARHRLDVYRPRGKGPFPVLVFLHGGGWMIGKKDNYLGLYGYGTIARCLAERGLVVVLPNYRLSPAVRHPAHIEDVARAFAWACRNARRYGGDPRRVFVGGHSAGGHLAALLATDPRYLRKVGLGPQAVRAVVALSGVYRVDNLDLRLVLNGPAGARLLEAEARPLALVFGDAETAREASPLSHVRRGLPPFLLVNAGWDLPPLKPMTRAFAAALKKSGCAVQVKTVSWRTHETLLFDILRRSAEPATVDLVVDFIRSHDRRR